MKKLLLSFTFFSMMSGIMAVPLNVDVPDVNFKAALINMGVDANLDGEIQYSEALLFDYIDVSSSNISDLTGIEAFTNLTELWCNGNNLTSLDVTQNTKLVILNCYANTLTSLDVLQNTALVQLRCQATQITSLDLSNNLLLEVLNCGYNTYLTSLDVSNNSALYALSCDGAGLSDLNVVDNPALTSLYCRYQPNLTTICINPLHEITASWKKDAAASWNTNCATSIEDNLVLDASVYITNFYSLLGQEMNEDQVEEGVYFVKYSDGSMKKAGRISLK